MRRLICGPFKQLLVQLLLQIYKSAGARIASQVSPLHHIFPQSRDKNGIAHAKPPRLRPRGQVMHTNQPRTVRRSGTTCKAAWRSKTEHGDDVIYVHCFSPILHAKCIIPQYINDHQSRASYQFGTKWRMHDTKLTQYTYMVTISSLIGKFCKTNSKHY